MAFYSPNLRDIAIIGYAGRFPGAGDVRQFWNNLCGGVESLSKLSDTDLMAAGIPRELQEHPNYVRVEAALKDCELFDAGFFGYSEREALIMDPQQRIFLESCWEALEDAGYDHRRIDSLVGVYAGAGVSNYWFEYLYRQREHLGTADPIEIAVGNNLSSLTARVSYKLDLEGPSVAVQTACSTSLVAVHLAVQSLLDQECDMALAGGVSLKLPLRSGYLYQVDGLLSPDGHCRPFDTQARGTIFGSGCGVVVLKRLRDAVGDGDLIRAVIRATAINNDGASKAGFSAPSQTAQSEVIGEALSAADLDPATISYVEMHGTGTSLGDYIEVAALRDAFGSREDRARCAIGSVKGNIGHLDAAAGIAGLIKTVLSIEHRAIPPSINCAQPLEQVNDASSGLFVNGSLRDWPAEGMLRAGVSSFGLGGTNCHVVVEEAPPLTEQPKPRKWSLIPLSAKTPEALSKMAERLLLRLQEESGAMFLSDVAYTSQVGRRQWEYRRSVVTDNRGSALELLRSDSRAVFASATNLGLALPGKANIHELGIVLYREEPVFHAHAAHCLDALSIPSVHEWPCHASYELIAFEYALVRTLMDWGLVPDIIWGTGIGAAVAEVFTASIRLQDVFSVLPTACTDETAQRSVTIERVEAKSDDALPRYRTIGWSSTPETAALKGQGDVLFHVGALPPTTGNAGYSAGSSKTFALVSSDLDRGHIYCVLGQLWECGLPVNWNRYAENHRRQRVSIPPYPFERKQCWVEPVLNKDIQLNRSIGAPNCSGATQLCVADTIEGRVQQIFQALLMRSDIGLNDSFLDMGGDSLLATQLTSRLRDVFEVVIPLRDILHFPTVSGIARLIEQAIQIAKRQKRECIVRIENRDACPLSFAQRRLYFLASLAPGEPTYNVSAAFRLRGEVDREILQQSLQLLISRHEALRTSFSIHDNEPIQRIAREACTSLGYVDLQGLCETEQRHALEEAVRAEVKTGFELGQAPLFRSKVLQLGPLDCVLTMTVHHIVADGWSMNIIIREMAKTYQALSQGEDPQLEPLDIQYVDYSAWQQRLLQGDNLQQLLAHWEKRLGGELPTLDIPSDHPRPRVRGNHGERQFVGVSRDTLSALHDLAQRNGATLYMTLLAAFAVLLHRYSGEQDLLIGSPIANRQGTELEGIVGCLMNVLVMRIDISGNPTFRELVGRVKNVALEAFANQDLPFDLLVNHLRPPRDLSRTPIFQTLFVLQNTPPADPKAKGFTIIPYDVDPEVSTYDVTLSLNEIEDSLEGWLEYNTELFAASTIRRMIGHFQVLLATIAANADRPIADLTVLTSQERRWLLQDLNANSVEHDPCCLHEIFQQQATRSWDAVAVCTGDAFITYGELNRRANQLAHYLRSCGAGPDTSVGIHVYPSIEALIGILGILKSGAAYVSIDPAYPAKRQDLILKEVDVSLIVTTDDLASDLFAPGAHLVRLDSEWSAIEKQPETVPQSGVVPGNLAYVVCTSGSTGTPLGVGVTHMGIANLVTAEANEYEVTQEDRVLLYTSLSFDASIFEILMALGHGAQLVTAKPIDLLPTSGFVDLLRTLNITNLATFPSALALIEDDDLPALRTLIVGGEACPPAVIERWGQGRKLFNSYGTSETTVWATSAECSKKCGKVFIGKAISNMQAYVLDAFMNPVPVGIVGEIYIGGIGLARGYLNFSDLTADRFAPHPFSKTPGQRLYRTGDLGRLWDDGNIECLGRKDHQEKVQGSRIELGEVETAIMKHDSVKQVVVKARGDGVDRVLVAYIVANSGHDVDSSVLRQFLGAWLPPYMIPSVYVQLQKLPLLPSGKIDHRALATSLFANPAAPNRAPVKNNALHSRIAAVVESVFDIHEIGLHDNFFESGANSLKLVRLKGQLDVAFNCNLTLLDLFQHPTVAGIASLLGVESRSTSMLSTTRARVHLRRQLQDQRSSAVH